MINKKAIHMRLYFGEIIYDINSRRENNGVLKLKKMAV